MTGQVQQESKFCDAATRLVKCSAIWKPRAEEYSQKLQFLARLEAQGFFNNPHLFSGCSHTFCYKCIIPKIEGKGVKTSQCPICNQPGWKRDLKPVHVLANIAEPICHLLTSAGMAVSEGVQLQSRAASDTASRQLSESKLQGPVGKQRTLAAVKPKAQNSSSMRKRSVAGQKKVTFAGGSDEQSKAAPSKSCTTPHQNAESHIQDKATKVRPVSADPVNAEQPPHNMSLVPDTYAELDGPQQKPEDGIQSIGLQQEGHADEVLSADVGTKNELHSPAGSRQGPRWLEESVPPQSMATAPQAVPVKPFTRTKLHRISEPSEPLHQAAESDKDSQPIIPVDADFTSDSMMPNGKRRKWLEKSKASSINSKKSLQRHDMGKRRAEQPVNPAQDQGAVASTAGKRKAGQSDISAQGEGAHAAEAGKRMSRQCAARHSEDKSFIRQFTAEVALGSAFNNPETAFASAAKEASAVGAPRTAGRDAAAQNSDAGSDEAQDRPEKAIESSRGMLIVSGGSTGHESDLVKADQATKADDRQIVDKRADGSQVTQKGQMPTSPSLGSEALASKLAEQEPIPETPEATRRFARIMPTVSPLEQQAAAQRHVEAAPHGHALSSAERSASMQWLGQDAGQPPSTMGDSQPSSKTASMQSPEQRSAGPPLPKRHEGQDGQHNGQHVQNGFERLMTVEEVQALGKELCSKATQYLPATDNEAEALRAATMAMRCILQEYADHASALGIVLPGSQSTHDLTRGQAQGCNTGLKQAGSVPGHPEGTMPSPDFTMGTSKSLTDIDAALIARGIRLQSLDVFS